MFHNSFYLIEIFFFHSTLLKVNVKPNSNITSIKSLSENNEYILITLNAAAREGEANKEICHYVASILKVNLEKGKLVLFLT